MADVDVKTDNRSLSMLGSHDRRFRLLVESLTDHAICMLDARGTVANWNAGAERASGFAASEMVGRHLACFYSGEDRAAGVPQLVLQTARNTGRHQGEFWRVRKDGARYWARVIISRISDDDGSLLGFALQTHDLTIERAHADRVAEMTRLLDLALANMPQGLCLFDANERLVLSNDGFRRIFGIHEGEVIQGRTYLDLLTVLLAVPSDDEGAPWVHNSPALMRERHLALMASRPDGVLIEERWKDKVIATTYRALAEGGCLITMYDITEKRQAEHRIEYLAHHDALTGLANRLHFQQRCTALLRPLGSPTLPGTTNSALLYLDLDRFKQINDTLGHASGDALLTMVADRIRGLVRHRDLAGRLGGDEFVVLQAEGAVHETNALAERLICELSRPFMIKGVQVSVGVSIGIALAPDHVADSDRLLQQADIALYKAKEDGRGCYRYYHTDMEALLCARRDMERDLREAVAAEEFELLYQPIVNLACNDVQGFEALLRWNSPTRGRVAPLDFIHLSEEAGLMPAIGDWVLRTACREAMRWPAHLVVSVNLSPTQFARNDLVETIEAALAAAGLPPARLELEITETAMIHNIENTAVTLKRLRALGIQVALDDFGTGYSSLSFVQSLPFTRIKIDRSFVQNLGERPESVAVVRAVAGLCTSLGVAATAEGVETEQQARILREERCTDIQGYLISRPCAAGDVLRWLAGFAEKAPIATTPLATIANAA